jgi:hypothetical protein
MRIACLGWGSLVWDPRQLPIRREWFSDGPLLPIEFARKSNDGRVTLVLLEKAPEVRSLWSLMSVTELPAAKEALAEREGSTSEDKTRNTGYWSAGGNSGGLRVDAIKKWAKLVGVEAVIWTSLAGNFNGAAQANLPDQVLPHIRGLSHEQRQNAERYVRRTPKQIDTEVRRKLERELGWLPMDCG